MQSVPEAIPWSSPSVCDEASDRVADLRRATDPDGTEVVGFRESPKTTGSTPENRRELDSRCGVESNLRSRWK